MQEPRRYCPVEGPLEVAGLARSAFYHQQQWVVDDHPLMRAGIAGEVDDQSDMRVVAEAGNRSEAVKQFLSHRPDITLMDIRMPELGGIEAIVDIRKSFPNARTIVLTTVAGDIQARRAFQAGAAGYLLKSLMRTDLIEPIRFVHAGGRRVPPDVAQQTAVHSGEDALSTRELEVLKALASGQSNMIIAATLKISESTVKNHVKRILDKLGANDRTNAVVIALRRGYLEL